MLTQTPNPQIMGILNLTPDSFFAASRAQDEYAISKRVDDMMSEGADIIDVGACSTRPDSVPVTAEEEMQRMRFGLEIISRRNAKIPLSIDTFRPEVARMAVQEYGATLINDVTEGKYGMFEEVSRLHVGYVLTSVEPTIERMIARFREELRTLDEMGENNVILDPGYGFGKDVITGNYTILNRQQEIKSAFPNNKLLVGVSRKRMIWQLLGIKPSESLGGTMCVNLLALERGADILRVHDVKSADETVKIYKKCCSTSL